METTFISLLPPILAIIVSILTKEVNLSLAIGLFFGAALYANFSIFDTVITAFDVLSSRVYGNMGVLIFIVLLGMIVHLMNMSGATKKYAAWAQKRLQTRKHTLLATFFLGIIIFVDDYFNCLTVGTIMRPIADRNKISREKLAYIIDSTAAPICMIAPISSWAAAVSSSLPEDSSIDGFQLFLKTIPANFYSLFALCMVLGTIIFNMDFGKMRKRELEAQNRNLETPEDDIRIYENDSEDIENNRSGVIDLILPVIGIIVFSIIAMLYTGGFFEGGISIPAAFADCDAVTGLAVGSLYTVLLVAVLYLPRKIVTPKEYLDGLVEGFKKMVPATLILTLAWSLGGICGGDYLNAGGFVGETVAKYSLPMELMPFLFFLISVLLAFSTGTSWGTFGILLPIALAVFGNDVNTLAVMTTAAVLSGSVCGDHLSPISDTTILSSTAAECEHYQHFITQVEYGLVTAIISSIGFLVAGMTGNIAAGFAVGVILLACLIVITKTVLSKEAK